MKPFKTGIILGRFQHVHIGHEKLINIGFNLCEKLIIFVGSAQESKTIRNPYDYEIRAKLLNIIYDEYVKSGVLEIHPLKDMTNENDLTVKWGQYVLDNAKQIIGSRPECVIYGKEEKIRKCFLEKDMIDITEVFVDKKSLEISATEIRKLLLDDESEKWQKYVNKKIFDKYDELRQILLDIHKGNN